MINRKATKSAWNLVPETSLALILAFLCSSVLAAERASEAGDPVDRLIALIPERITYVEDQSQHVHQLTVERKGTHVVKIRDLHRIFETTPAGQKHVECHKLWVLDLSKLDPEGVVLTTDSASQILECFTPRLRESIKLFLLGGTIRQVDSSGEVQETILNPSISREYRFVIRLPQDTVRENEALRDLIRQTAHSQSGP